MKTTIFYLPVLLLFFLLQIGNSNGHTLSKIQTNDENEKVKKEFLATWEYLNSADFTDSLAFKKYLEFYVDDYVHFYKEGDPPSIGKNSLLWIGNFLKNNKPHFDVSIDRVEVSDDLAVIFYHYREIMINRKTGETTFDGMHSAMMVLKKKESGNWKIVFNKWGIGD